MRLAHIQKVVHRGNVQRDDVLEAVARWLSAFDIPPPPPAGTKDLRGRLLRVCASQDQEVIRFFFPRRTIPFSNRMLKEAVRRLRRRGAEIHRVELSVEAYARWIDARGLKDSEELRYEFATKLPTEA